MTDHIVRGDAAALIVEHIDGYGPYKARTSPWTLMKVANSFDDETRDLVKEAWERLRAGVSKCIPIDLQVMLTRSGRIVIIDPEQISLGADTKLVTWNDALRLAFRPE